MSTKTKQRGLTLVEVLVSLGILGTIILFSVTMGTTAMRTTQNNSNKQFATQKAVAMMEELRALVQTVEGANAIVLDDFDDGTTNQTVLTTRKDVTDPADPASGNTRIGSEWLFERRVTVQRVKGVSDVRLVNVRVFVRDAGGLRPLAEVAGIVSTIGQNMPPTQEYDVYLIALENVPGWWVYMQNMIPFVDGAMSDLESRNPGLKFRKHWINKLSYGRDEMYTPYVNSGTPSTDPIDYVYFYPGTLPEGSAVGEYYPPDYFKGRVAIDDINKPVNADNAAPYTLADQFNHAKRYYEEKALFDSRVDAGLEDENTPTLRLLLDDMILHPNNYRNAILINLHGELLPFPPIRNYSDAAKLPESNVRVVTHPEKLHYDNTEGMKLRVYSYLSDPAAAGEWLNEPIVITMKGIDWTPVKGDIRALTGGVDFDGLTNGATKIDYYNWFDAEQSPKLDGMWWNTTKFTDASGEHYTVIRLYNSPLRSPCAKKTNDCDEGGLASTARLYGLEYIPSPLEDVDDLTNAEIFTTNLDDTGSAPKNTARWVITIPQFALPNNDTHYEIETHVGLKETGYPNSSRTFVWRGTDLWLFGDDTHDPHLPMSERYQFLGDPRHCPYADLKRPHNDSGLVGRDRLGMGYNRYFDDFQYDPPSDDPINAYTSWPGWSYKDSDGVWFGIKNDKTTWSSTDDDGWNRGIDFDVPRAFQILRTAVTRTNAVYTTMTGFSYYYMGIGGEIGYDADNGFPKSLPVSLRPFDGTDLSGYEQSITGGGVKYVRQWTDKDDTGYWWAMPWIGEIWPDSAWKTWQAEGNLPTGPTSGNFRRVRRDAIGKGAQASARLPKGTALEDSQSVTADPGSTTFFWTGKASATFHHYHSNTKTNGIREPAGAAIETAYNTPIPATIHNRRPFEYDADNQGANPDHFLQDAYGPITKLLNLATFYRHETYDYGSALVAMRSDKDPAFVVVNGLSPTGQSGVAFISRWSFLSLMESFFTAGRYSTVSSSGPFDERRVRQLPRVAITSPSDKDEIVDPVSLTVTWDSKWRRWDGLKYTSAYPDNFSEDATVKYRLLYSRDNGKEWRHVDDQPAEPGKRLPGEEKYLQTGTSFVLSTPAATFPKGNYLLRVEAYRDLGNLPMPLHYSYHQYRAFIKRSS